MSVIDFPPCPSAELTTNRSTFSYLQIFHWFELLQTLIVSSFVRDTNREREIIDHNLEIQLLRFKCSTLDSFRNRSLICGCFVSDRFKPEVSKKPKNLDQNILSDLVSALKSIQNVSGVLLDQSSCQS